MGGSAFSERFEAVAPTLAATPEEDEEEAILGGVAGGPSDGTSCLTPFILVTSRRASGQDLERGRERQSLHNEIEAKKDQRRWCHGSSLVLSRLISLSTVNEGATRRYCKVPCSDRCCPAAKSDVPLSKVRAWQKSGNAARWLAKASCRHTVHKNRFFRFCFCFLFSGT